MQPWRRCETDFNFDRHLIVFMTQNAFWAELSRHITKVPTMDIPTAAIAYDPKMDTLVLWYNPEFLRKESNLAINGVIVHEFSHITYGHLVGRVKTPPKLWNIGTDCAINSIIEQTAGSPKEDDIPGARCLPRIALMPGTRPYLDPEVMEKMKPEDVAATTALADVIENLPKMKSSEFYFNKIMEDMKKKGHDISKEMKGLKIKIKMPGQPGDGSDDGEEGEGFAIGEMDDHDMWDELPAEMREYVESKVKSIVEKAVNEADKQSGGWGNIPHEIASEIRKSVSTIVNWRAVLKQFVGALVRGERTSTIKRINRRYPYIHPGVKRGYTARLLVAIDQSGSVSDKMLESFVAELSTLTKRVSVDILPFDCSADSKEIFEWRKGTQPKVKRTRMGGTNFDAPTNIVNDPKNRGRWDGLLICTDGEAPAPGPSRVRRGWVLGEGQKLYFPSDELQVFVDDAKPLQGAWR
ncbi:MAG: VWA-like domain-containing protein [Candidatus Paceibacterota bacterium]|jgi:predicted metal-dependent peptidase